MTNIKGLARSCPSGGCEGESIPGFSPSFWLLWAILSIPWLVDTLLQCLPLSLHGILPMRVCAQISLFS